MKADLLTDIFKAYYDARRNKRNTYSQLEFELKLEDNLISLYDEINERRYKPSSSVCFIITDPVKREVFASQFRDRVVHHLYYNYVYPIFERDFIFDSYSCRKGKGTLCGIQRFEHHIRSCTDNYTQPAYIAKLDISGYFMSINRQSLKELILSVLDKYWNRKSANGKKWEDCLDRDLIIYLTEVITDKDPLENCRIKGDKSNWEGLPDSKCLSKSPKGTGLPIGDLTSQLFSNIYLNRLDQYVKRELGHKYYGRYVDDFYIVDKDIAKLRQSILLIRRFLESIGLILHPRKIILQRCNKSIAFLGAVVRPHRRHVTHRTLKAFRAKLHECENMCKSDALLSKHQLKQILNSMNSYLGYFQHFNTYRYLNKILPKSTLLKYFAFASDRKIRYAKMVLFAKK